MHISRYQRTRQKSEVSGRTINMEVGLIRMTMIKHRVWHNISPDVRMLQENEDVGRALAQDEAQRILAAAQSSISRSLYPALLISMHTGLRSEELRMLRWRQVDFLKEEIRVGKSKTGGGSGRVLPLSATALSCLKEWRGLFLDARPDHFVFPTEKYKQNKRDAPGGSVEVYDRDPSKPVGNWKRAWTTCRKVAKVSCRWHDMRHTFVSWMGENKVAEQTLMSMTGHLSRKMLERYSHARMEAKRAAVRTLDAKPASEHETVADGSQDAAPEGSPQRSPQPESSEGRRLN